MTTALVEKVDRKPCECGRGDKIRMLDGTLWVWACRACNRVEADPKSPKKPKPPPRKLALEAAVVEESEKQIRMMDEAYEHAPRCHALWMLFHVPNGAGYLSKRMAEHFRRMGIKSGVPDLFLPVPRKGYHGLWLELKREGEKPTKAQEAWHRLLRQEGYLVLVMEGPWREAWEAICAYLDYDPYGE